MQKRAKYAVTSHSFVPIAFKTLRPINMDGQRFLDILGERLSSVFGDPRETMFLYQRLSVLIQIFNLVAFRGIILADTWRRHGVYLNYPIAMAKRCFQFISKRVEGWWIGYVIWKVIPDERSSSTKSSDAWSSSYTWSCQAIVIHWTYWTPGMIRWDEWCEVHWLIDLMYFEGQSYYLKVDARLYR